MKEFDIIEHFFKQRSYQRRDVQLGIGDDCAVVTVPPGQSLVVTTDTLISNVHFPENTPADAIAHKAVAVNLSDLASLGAEPAWINLSLSLPHADEQWLEKFSSGLHEICEYFSVQLIGGDTVKGPLSITITAQGFVPEGQPIQRSGAKPGDWLYVTGTLGDAGLGLDAALGKTFIPAAHSQFINTRFNYPSPRVLAGTLLRKVANACIDISDGLLADLGHLVKASESGAIIQVDQLPLSESMRVLVDSEQAIRYALTAGDDYELLFTVSEEQKGNLEIALSGANIPVTCIGQLTGGQSKVELRNADSPYVFEGQGYQHFAADQ